MNFCEPTTNPRESGRKGGGGGGGGGGGCRRGIILSRLLRRQVSSSRHSAAAAAAMDDSLLVGEMGAASAAAAMVAQCGGGENGPPGPYDDRSSTCGSDAPQAGGGAGGNKNHIIVDFPPKEGAVGMKRDETSTTICSAATAESSTAAVEASAQGQQQQHSSWKRFFDGLLSSVFAPESVGYPSASSTAAPRAPLPRLPPKVLLEGTVTAEEHFALVDGIMERCKGLHGEDGLREAGFDYREVLCERHRRRQRGTAGEGAGDAEGLSDDASVDSFGEEDVNSGNDDDDAVHCTECATRLYRTTTSTLITQTNRPRYIADCEMYDEIARLCQEYAQDVMRREGSLEWVTVCDDDREGAPVRALVHRGHGLYRKQSMAAEADGEGDMGDWKVGDDAYGIEDGAAASADEDEKPALSPALTPALAPAPAAVPLPGASPSNRNRRASPRRKSSTLLIATGKGKVRAGIFSRSHLMTSGIEPSTALPMVREARRRGMRCVIPDPNARGDRRGMETFGRTVSAVMDHEDHRDADEDDLGEDSPGMSDGAARGDNVSSAGGNGTSCAAAQDTDDQRDGPLYVLAHSASGAQFVRHLRESASSHLVPRIKAVAFTDSTHNVQWTKKHTDDHHPRLAEMLESPEALYVRSNSVRDDAGWTGQGRERSMREAGEEAEGDKFWRHRFGDVQTVWAGTEDHSLTNWAAHLQIWDHFDRFFEGSKDESGDGESESGEGEGNASESSAGSEEGVAEASGKEGDGMR